MDAAINDLSRSAGNRGCAAHLSDRRRVVLTYPRSRSGAPHALGDWHDVADDRYAQRSFRFPQAGQSRHLSAPFIARDSLNRWQQRPFPFQAACSDGHARRPALPRLTSLNASTCRSKTLGPGRRGAALPTQGQFSKLVTVLSRPSALFFLPEPPTAAGMPTTLRSAPALAGHKLGPDEARQIRWAPQATRTHIVDPARRRTEAGDPPSIQRNGQSCEASRHGARAVGGLCQPADGLEQCLRGVSDLAGILGESERSGVAAQHGKEQHSRASGPGDDYAPLVAVNTAYHPTARIFTLFHEVGHLLTRTDAACQSFVLPGRHDGSVERWCEQFAASFLLPEDGLRTVAARYDVSSNAPTAQPDTARLIAGRFFVSARATAIRLQEIGLAEPTLYLAVASQFAERDWSDFSGGGSGRGQPASAKRVGQLGTRLPNLLLSAADRGRLTTRDLADFLNLTTGKLDDLRGLLLEPG